MGVKCKEGTQKAGLGDGRGMLSCDAVVGAVRVSFLPYPSRQFLAKLDVFGEAVGCSMKPESGHVLAMPGTHWVLFRPTTTLWEAQIEQLPGLVVHVGTMCVQPASAWGNKLPGAVLGRPGCFMAPHFSFCIYVKSSLHPWFQADLAF